MTDPTPFGTPRRRQRPLFGCALRLAGLAGTLWGGLMVILAATKTKTVFVPVNGVGAMVQDALIVAGVGLWGALSLVVGLRMRRHGRRHHVRVVRTMEEARREPYVLYLRPFAEDATGTLMRHAFTRWMGVGGSLVSGSSLTLEEGVCRTFSAFGRPLAVGEPDEALPLAGSRRLYLPLHDWQPTVTSLITDARLVLLVAGTSEGTLWELTEVMRLRRPESVLVLLYADRQTDDLGVREAYDDFRAAAERELSARAEELRQVHGPDWQPPRFPPLPGFHDPDRLKWTTLLRAVVRFRSDWTPEIVLLDPTAVDAWTHEGRVRKMTRTQVLPLLTRLHDDLNGLDGSAVGAVRGAALPTLPMDPR
ncbi:MULTISPECIES: hypothetical protein [unclassified Streptomyces]|uniref:hypothetical protein n=1 Tax=unclassified Streptomyces TaxID=2593676 RepID=UPI002E7A9670|nr:MULTISPECIES: hypothetical protein [unclassified Streptomyces]MEE1761858.1 hypothetical protein [Streptomyces sp. SP18BB07]MEE1835354.1 hypothetical protein [Streptomyces sp. SP17KL33]